MIVRSEQAEGSMEPDSWEKTNIASEQRSHSIDYGKVISAHGNVTQIKSTYFEDYKEICSEEGDLKIAVSRNGSEKSLCSNCKDNANKGDGLSYVNKSVNEMNRTERSLFDENVSPNIAKSAPELLSNILEGRNIPLDSTTPLDNRPDWIDDAKLKRGRKFALKNLLAVIYAEMLSLAFLLSNRGSIEGLIFTGNSHSPITAFKRYFSTVKRVISWYESDYWEKGSEARKNIMAVRRVHANVASMMSSSTPEQVRRLSSLKERHVPSLSSPLRLVQRDFEDSVGKAPTGCLFASVASLSRERPIGYVHLNQLELSITQFGFMGLLLLFPEKFGVAGASEAELEAFVHLWRALGYSLGIKDKYNLCAGTLSETRERCRAVLEKWLKPCLSEASRDWEHMYRCVVEGSSYYVPVNTYGGSLAYLCWITGVNAPRLMASLSWFERMLYVVQRISLCYLCYLPGFMAFINLLLRISLWRAEKFSFFIENYERKKNLYSSKAVELRTCTLL